MVKLFILSALQIALLHSAVAQYQGQSNCVTPNGVPGTCIGVRQCAPLLNLLQQRPLPPETVDFLRLSQCGFDGGDPSVCCPAQGTTTPRNNRPGPGFTDRPLQPSIDQPNIGSNTDDANIQYNFENNPLLYDDCGKDLTQRIVGGNRTELDEFPWMALLEYTRPTGKATLCGGVLISRRYVLTAAHCLKGKDLPTSWRLEGVRLGEYDTETHPDCIKDDEDSSVCADDPLTVGVEELIAHENYLPTQRDQNYDIALIRLSRDVRFTNYIKPICLPSTATINKRVFAAGWGKTENGSSSNVKLKVALPITDKEQCKITYRNAGVRLGYGQICAGGQKGKDSCRGDSGGPLMSVDRRNDGSGRWVAVGIVSFGPQPCGMIGWPGVYSRVIDFVPWILSKMRP